MLAQFHFSLELVHWERWTTLLVGLSTAGLMLIMVRILARGRNQAPPRPPALPEDPCEYGTVHERRASIRRHGKTVSVLISDANAKAEPFPGSVRNRSLDGLSLAVPSAVEVSMILSVRIADADPSTPWVQVQVMWCSEQNGRCELGCKFVHRPPYSQLLLFG